ncbi:hypothetical protein ACFV19_14770 [Streptomyces griseoluteus]|uniref:hypothetical protein n=1 Tax=Streptomyces griseoluteus TaxID=29306 RepID=UPI0036969F77
MAVEARTAAPVMLLKVFTQRPESAAHVAMLVNGSAACAAAEAGLEIPPGRPDGWGACGYRPGTHA